MVIWAGEAQKTKQKPIRMKDWNGPGMPMEMKQVEDVQKNKMGQGSPKVMKWAKEAQNSMSTNPTIVLGYWN